MNKIKTLLRENGIWIGKLLRVGSWLALFVSVFMLFGYSVPMLTEDYASAADSMFADRPIALYDAALQRYQEKDYDGAVRVLNEAYNECLGAQGAVTADNRKQAADIKFLTGNALVKAKQLQQAVEAYKDTLRLDPTNLEAKYNLEFLQQMNGGKGPGDGDGDGKDPSKPGTAPGKGIKKGI